jgi:hypothetical protein
MRRSAALLFTATAILIGQSPVLDGGRLDPAWFGPGVVFQPSKTFGFQWLKPGLDLHHRSLRLQAWEPAAWMLGKRAMKDQLLVVRMKPNLQPELDKRLRRGLKGALPVSPQGDVLLLGRVVDAIGESEDGMVSGPSSLSFDLKLVDSDTGEPLGAFHDTLKGVGHEAVEGQYGRWCEDLGRLLATLAVPPVVAKPAQAAPPPAFDLEGALRRIEGLKWDGLLSDEDYQALRKKATEKAAGKVD